MSTLIWLSGFLSFSIDYLFIVAGIVLVLASIVLPLLKIAAGPLGYLAGGAPSGIMRYAGLTLAALGCFWLYGDKRADAAIAEYRATALVAVNAERDRQQAAAVAELQQQHAAELARLQATTTAKARIANAAPAPAACRVLPAGGIALDELRSRRDPGAGAVHPAGRADDALRPAKPAP